MPENLYSMAYVQSLIYYIPHNEDRVITLSVCEIANM